MRLFDQLPMYHMKTLLGALNTIVGRENIYQPTTGTASVHPESNDNGIRLLFFIEEPSSSPGLPRA